MIHRTTVVAVASIMVGCWAAVAQETAIGGDEIDASANRIAEDELKTQLQKALDGLNTARAARGAAQPAAGRAAAPAQWAAEWGSSDEEEQPGRIVNGVLTPRFPTAAAVIKAEDGDVKSATPWCTGTLIGCETILTANHCVAADRDKNHYFVYLQHAGIFSVTSISPAHDEYQFPHADLAVLKLGAPVDGIVPTRIHTGSELPSGTSAKILGFGRTGGINFDYGIKRVGTMKIKPCVRAKIESVGGFVPPGKMTVLCWDFTAPAGPPGSNSNTCNADSGGPLFYAPSPGARRVVAGVTSGGTEEDCLVEDHSYDVDVRQFADWIEEQAGTDLASTSCGSLPAFGSKDVRLRYATNAGNVLKAGESKEYKFPIPANTARLRVALEGEDGQQVATNMDLHVKKGAAPTATDHDCAAVGASSYAFCEITDPEPGDWFGRATQSGGDGRFQLVATIYRKLP